MELIWDSAWDSILIFALLLRRDTMELKTLVDH